MRKKAKGATPAAGGRPRAKAEKVVVKVTVRYAELEVVGTDADVAKLLETFAQLLLPPAR